MEPARGIFYSDRINIASHCVNSQAFWKKAVCNYVFIGLPQRLEKLMESERNRFIMVSMDYVQFIASIYIEVYRLPLTLDTSAIKGSGHYW